MKQLMMLVLALFIIVGTSAQAAVAVFTDHASFDAAVGPTVTEDFNSYTSEIPFHTIPLDVGDFTLSMTGSPSTVSSRNKIDIPPPEWPQFGIDGTNIVNVLTGQGDSLLITFNSPIRAFGAYFSAFNDDSFRTNIVIGSYIFSPSVTSGDVIRFFGFVSDAPFTVIEVRGVNNDGFGIDNFSYSATIGSTPPVADAGDDITVYAGPDGTAVVKLNGSDSYDADDDPLEYFWFENGSEIARGVDPNVVLAVGGHVIDLIVNDGNSNSEPDSVVVTVLEMPNTAPVADAGVDVTVFAGPDGTATVGLDGSGSYDADEDELEYFWFNDANDLIAEGVDPNVVFAAGVHVIELVVDDGELSSEPNSVVVTVIEAVEAQARVYPRVLNITSRGRFVIARMQLPDGVSTDDIESDSLTLTIGDVTIESVRQRGVTSADRHYVFGFFDRGRVIAQADGKGKLDIIIAGKLTSGQCIYGEDTIKTVKSNGPKKPTPSRRPVRSGKGRRANR